MTSNVAGGFSGELGLVGLFDISQLLILNRATGRLSITHGERKGSLYFDDGRIVNAVDDRYAEGEAAAYQVFTWREGHFEFRPEPASGTALIHESPDGLMLEAARRMDESAIAAGETPAASEAARLLEHQSSLDTLRDVFRSVVSDARKPTAWPGTPTAFSPTRLYSLARAGDRLLFRPGQPPRLCQGGIWSEPREAALDAEAFAQLRAGLLAASTPLNSDPTVANPPRRLELANGITICVTLIEEMGVETLWLHPFEFPPPSASGLGLDAPALDSVLGVTHGLVLIGGSDAVSARRLLHALLAARDAAHPDLTLLVSDDSTYRHAITHGVIVAATPARATALLAALEPQLLVLDPAVDTGLLAAAHAVGIWWVGATGADAAAMACRWVATALGDAEHPRLAALTTLPIVLAYAEGAADDAHDLGCRVARLGETERSLLFAGDVTGLAAALARSGGPPQLRPVRRAS